jgi:signal transduction histidine kinase
VFLFVRCFRSFIIRKRLLYLFVCFLLCVTTSAQIRFFYNEAQYTGSTEAVRFYIDSSADHSISRFEHIRRHLQPLGNNTVNLSYKNKQLWLQIPLSSIAERDALKNIMVRNPHINYLQAWIFKGDHLLTAFRTTGDHLPFASRTLPYADFVFPVPVENHNSLSFVFLIDKRNEQLNIPIHFLTDSGFATYNRRKNLLAGLITGMGLFLFLLSSFLFYTIREKLYIYYGLYILTIFFFIFSDNGYSLMYLFPNHPFPADFTRPLAISFSSPLYMLFVLSLLNAKQTLPVWYKCCVRFIRLYMLSTLISIFFMPETGTIRILLVWLMQIYQLMATLIMLTIAIKAVRRKINYSGYIVCTCLIILITSFLYTQFISGYIPDTFITRNLMYIGFTAEICVLAFLLTLRFKQYKDQSERLLRTTNLQQEQIFKSISDYQEKEMQRYSSLLHDSVGARLSAIRFNLESLSENETEAKLNKSISDIGKLANDVRQYSHSLSPVLLQKKGLLGAVQEIVDSVNESKGIYIQFESIGSLQKASFRYELMLYNILQELIQNILKHAHASEVIIQLILEEELIYLFVEDNGKGFTPSLIKEGIGFSQIRQLVTFVKGSLTIDAKESRGCKITLEFPVLPDETNQPNPFS